VPESLRDVINARLDGLPTETLELLGVAAVFGREFEASALAELAEVPLERTKRCLEHAEAAGIVTAASRRFPWAAEGRFLRDLVDLSGGLVRDTPEQTAVLVTL
jgi:predicted ATPase